MEQAWQMAKRLGKKLGKKLLKFILVKTAPVTLPLLGILLLMFLAYVLIFEMPKQAIADTWDNTTDRVASWFYGTSEKQQNDIFEQYQALAERWKEGLTADQQLQIEPYAFNWEWLAAVDRALNDPSFLETYGGTETKELTLHPEQTFKEVRPRFTWVTKEKVTTQQVVVEVEGNPNSPMTGPPSYEVRTIQTSVPVKLLERAETIYGTYDYSYKNEVSTSTTPSATGPLSTKVVEPRLERVETVEDNWKPLRHILKQHGVTRASDQDFLLEYWLSFLSDDDGSDNPMTDWTPVNGQLIWPTEGRDITSKFGVRIHPITGVKKMHYGIDIGVPTGTPVFAAREGTVIFAGAMGTAGQAVIIKHDNGLETRYYHLNRVDVLNGQVVTAREQVAESGNSGSSTGPHLHFEVRLSGTPVNPLLYFGYSESASSILTYRALNISVLIQWLNDRDSALANADVLRLIDQAAKSQNIDPYLLIAITGAEQSFVPRSNPSAEKIIRNPWNVFGNWKVGRGSMLTIGEAARIAAKTIVKLSKEKPSTVDAIEWLSSRNNPNGYYAADPNWWRNVSSIYQQFSNF
ncbi:M23 family metallopeptidase [Paenibacillus sonchi]|uniref:M23 family metallopeptidase n=1 Tax=Paenibacillus sonchi TaxID=373687 RepID=UPI001E5C03CD|nr:M23 family metallopeptidase [Paenibacillus sonchi]MCE3203488.1 M23 family metallopeptidase [Paenibacillus sonchi]